MGEAKEVLWQKEVSIHGQKLLLGSNFDGMVWGREDEDKRRQEIG
jgi:hypothetical protein